MVQGDQYYIPCAIKDHEGNPVTPESCVGIKIQIGKIEKSYPDGGLIFQNSKWYFPITQEESLNLTNTVYQCQVKFNSTDISTSRQKVFNVQPSIIREVWNEDE